MSSTEEDGPEQAEAEVDEEDPESEEFGDGGATKIRFRNKSNRKRVAVLEKPGKSQ